MTTVAGYRTWPLALIFAFYAPPPLLLEVLVAPWSKHAVCFTVDLQGPSQGGHGRPAVGLKLLVAMPKSWCGYQPSTPSMHATLPNDEDDDVAAILVALNLLLKAQFRSLRDATQAAECRVAELEAVPRSSQTDEDAVEYFFLANCLEKCSYIEEEQVPTTDGRDQALH